MKKIIIKNNQKNLDLKGLVLDEGKIKLFKTDIKVGESIYIPVDLVYYKEEKDDITKYRLTRIINEEFLEMSKYPGILMTMLSTLGYYAPDIIEGEIITYSYKDVHIKTDDGSIYIFVKDA